MLGDGSDYDEYGYEIDYHAVKGEGCGFNNISPHGWHYDSQYDYNRIDGKSWI